MAQLQTLALLALLLVGASSQDIRAPPRIIYPTATTNIYNSTSSSVVVKCKAGGIPQPTYKWMQNGTVVIRTNIITYNSTTGDLSISGLTTREEATYICIATNFFDNGLGGRVEASSWSAPVRIYQTRIDRFGGPTRLISAPQFTYMRLACDGQKAVVGESIIYGWYSGDGRKIDMYGDRLFIDQTGNLHFTYVLAADSNLDIYTCGISSASDDFIRLGTQYKLTVTPSTTTGAIQPQLQYSNTNVKGILYSSVKLECFFSGYDPASASAPSIQWFDDASKLITPSSKYNFTSYGRVLTISNLTEDDEKQYTCTATNSAGQTSTLVFLNVTSGPIWVPMAPRDQTVPENTDVQFSCAARSASGETPPSPPVWRINGAIMGSHTDPNKFYLSADGNVLNIKNVKKSTDIMCVQCQVSNDIDTALANACLNVVLPIVVKTPNPMQEVKYGERVDLTITATTDPSLTLSYIWLIQNTMYTGSDHPSYMFYDPFTQLAYIDTSELSKSQFYSLFGNYRRIISNGVETKIVDIGVVPTGPQVNTTAEPTTPFVDEPSEINNTRVVESSTTSRLPISTPPTIQSIRNDFDCHLTHMDVYVPVELAPNSVLRLKDSSCQLQNNGTHYVTSFTYDQCNTTMDYYYTNLVLVKNEITVHVNLDTVDLVRFSPDYTIPLTCVVRVNNSAVDGAFQAVDRDPYSPQYGQSPNFEMKEYNSSLYQDEITQFPVKVPINREVYFELSLINARINNSGIKVDKCEATPTSNANDPNRFLLISDGCPTTQAVKIQPRPELNRFRFSVQTFHFSAPVNKDNLVYVHCYLSLCLASDCATTCPEPRRRRRRSSRRLVSETLISGVHIITPH